MPRRTMNPRAALAALSLAALSLAALSLAALSLAALSLAARLSPDKPAPASTSASRPCALAAQNVIFTDGAERFAAP
ncbi:MAG: hypothetical protein RL685_3204 [Pseudomonadota bacterium]|jgi:hypothetical protein